MLLEKYYPRNKKKLSNESSLYERINGHAIEARIYSESPNNDFLPGNGRLLFYKEPKAVGIKMTPLFNLEGIVRLESGVRESDEISIFYDPMIAKLVVWG